MSRKVQVQKYKVRAGHSAGVDFLDIAQHLLTVPVAGKISLNVVVLERFRGQKDVTGVVLNNNDVELSAGGVRS